MSTTVALPELRPAHWTEAIGPAGRCLAFLGLLARRKPLGFAGLVVLTLMVVLAIRPSVFATNGPASDTGERFARYCLGPQDTFLCPTIREAGTTLGGLRITEGRVVEGKLSRPLGTDQLGRDIYSRIVYGTRVAVVVGFGAVILGALVSVLIGVTSGYLGGRYDLSVQRVVDSVMAIPPLVLLLALPNMIGGPDYKKLIAILGILGGVAGSRVIRAAVLGTCSAQFIEAARALGATDARVMSVHVLPNIFGPLMVQATLGLGAAILAEAALSFLGLGIAQADRPTWGYMLNLARQVAAQQPWQAVWPGLAIAVAVFSVNMLGDALRDLLDPRLRGVRGRFG